MTNMIAGPRACSPGAERGMTAQLSLDLIGGVAGSPARVRSRRRRRGIGRCESPIERQLAFAFADIGEFRWSIPGDDPHELGRWEQLSVAILSQPEVGPFRPDFGVARIGWRPGQTGTAPVLISTVNVASAGSLLLALVAIAAREFDDGVIRLGFRFFTGRRSMVEIGERIEHSRKTPRLHIQPGHAEFLCH